MKIVQRLTLTAMLAASVLLATGCSDNGAPVAPTSSTSEVPVAATATATATAAAPAPTNVPVVALPAGIVAKGVANDGKGKYLQTSIADTDPAMKYNPSIADDAAKAHYSEADLAEAQKVIVKFIAEEAIDSTLNGGNDVDGWFAAHKDQIHPSNQAIMLQDIKSDGKDILARERWIAERPGYSYRHGTDTPRIQSRLITPTKLSFVQSGNLQGLMLDTKATWTMPVTGGSHTGIQSTTAEISFAVAKDVDGKWKIAGYDTNYHTAEG